MLDWHSCQLCYPLEIKLLLLLLLLLQSACLVVNPIKVNNFAALFNCTATGSASDLHVMKDPA